jgi:tetratricopeptide (TPR) repeat protein
MNIDENIQLALKYHQSGNLSEAENIYSEILRDEPNNLYALHYLGILYYQLRNYDSAIKYIKKVLELNPTAADAFYNLGNVYKDSGHLNEAINYFQKSLELNPQNADAHNNQGIIYKDKGQIDEAITSFQKAIQLNPDHVIAYYNLGGIYKDKKQFDDAISCYEKVLGLNPDIIAVYFNLGVIFQEKKQFDDAIPYYQKAIQLNPDFVEAYFNLGNILKEKGQIDDAIAYFQKAIKLNPNFAETYNNLAAVLQDKGQLDQAINCYEKLITLSPNFVESYIALGNIYQTLGILDKAIFYYQKAIELERDNALAHFNLAFCLFSLGDLNRGWKEYVWRWKTKKGIDYLRRFSQPLWTGFDISMSTVLLRDEPLGTAGFGDTIQFIRYAPLIAKRGVKLIFECKKELISLLRNVEGIHQIIELGGQLPRFDVHCLLLDLPFIFDISLDNIPAEVPYIPINPVLVQKWEKKMQDYKGKFKVGLIWAAGQGGGDRSCTFKSYSSLKLGDDIIFYSLQKGAAAGEVKNTPNGMQLIDLTEEIHDFTDTAALIENLDLVISVDTAGAHLAGALGKPVWTLLPFISPWRWMLDREDSPWYPTMRLFRQPSPGDWESVIVKVKDELLKLLGKN